MRRRLAKSYSGGQIFPEAERGRSSSFVRKVTASLVILGATHVLAESPPPFRLLRYDEDYGNLSTSYPALQEPWENLKFIPFTSTHVDGAYISVGGEVRFQYIVKWDDQFGRVPGEERSFQQRYMVHADVVWPKRFRIFSQWISAWEEGRKPQALPTDIDHLDVQQLFGEISLSPEAPKTNYLRVGRQEILLGAHELLKVREGPNIRLAFDGLRAHVARDRIDADVFATTVVQPKPGVFDDAWFDDTIRFCGANAGWAPTVSGFSGLRVDAFMFDYYNRFLRYEQASGPEHRRTYGLRSSGRRGPWEFDYEASLQSGTLGTLNIHAWGVALFTAYRWDAVITKPKLTFGLSSVTGDRNRNDHELNTFNCLFARGDYFGDTSLLTGSNTLDASLLGECSPSARLHVSFQWDRLWRSSTSDGLYAPPLVYIRSGAVSDSRDIGNQLTLALTLNANRFITVQAIGAVFLAGEFIKAGPSKKDTDGVTLRTQFKF